MPLLAIAGLLCVVLRLCTEKEIFDENDHFRLFIQTQKYVGEHLDLCAAPQRDVICPEWAWSRPDEDHSLRFSAMGWYFAREMSRNIARITRLMLQYR